VLHSIAGLIMIGVAALGIILLHVPDSIALLAGGDEIGIHESVPGFWLIIASPFYGLVAGGVLLVRRDKKRDSARTGNSLIR